MFRLFLRSPLFILIFLSPLYSGPEFLQSHRAEKSGCFMILVGKNATTDGSVLLAHNNDLTGIEASLIEKHPRRLHAEDQMITFPSGLQIPQVQETYGWLVMRIEAGFEEGDAVAINQFQVAIAGGVALGRDRNEKAKQADPLVEKGLTGGVRYIALQRAKTARECVKLIGSLYTTYGVTYPSGVGIADPHEVWYMESGGGRSWAAVRIPDNCYWVQANGYRIGVIDPADTANVIISPGLLKFCVEKGLWNPQEGPFRFKNAFGGAYRSSSEEKYYNTRRVWRGMDMLSPSLKLDPESDEFPEVAFPDEKIDLKILFRILRDQYEETPYAGITEEGTSSKGERFIASSKCVHTDVIQLRAYMPDGIGGVMWAGLSMPRATPYIPFYFGTPARYDSLSQIPQAYSKAGSVEESAFYIYKMVYDLLLKNYKNGNNVFNEVWNGWNNIELISLKLQAEIEATALTFLENENYNSRTGEEAFMFLARYSHGVANRAVMEAKSAIRRLETELHSPEQ